MRVFLALVSKSGPLEPELADQVPAFAALALPFRHAPYRSESWQSETGRQAVFVWDNAVEPGGERPLIHVAGTTALALAGYVSHPAVADPWDVSAVAHALDQPGSDVSQLGGVFALLRADGHADEVQVWKATSRTAPVYWVDTPGFYAVGTRALLLAMLRSGTARPRYEPAALVPFLATGRFASEDTPFQGVHRLPPNSHLQLSRFGASVTPTDDFERTWGTFQPTPAGYDDFAELLLMSVRPLRSSHVVCSLTGGKDSRLAVATLHRAGVEFSTQTSGFPETPDVIVAGMVADVLGVPHHRSPLAASGNDDQTTVTIDLLDRTSAALFGGDGMLSGYENLRPAPRYSPNYVAVGGHGGEVAVRDSFGAGLVTWAGAEQILQDYYLHILATLAEPSAFRRYASFLSGWLASEQRAGLAPTSALDRFAFRYDLGVSGVGPVVTEINRRGWYPFLDNQVMKAGAQIREDVKTREELIHNLMLRLAPELLNVPLANKVWTFPAQTGGNGAKEHRVVPPVTARAGSRGAFNWRRHWTRELYDAFYAQIFENAGASALFEVLNRDVFQQWFLQQRGEPNPDADATRVAWSALSASVLLSNTWLEPDVRGGQVSIPVPR